MKMLMVICDRNITKKIINLLNQNEIKYHASFYGKGTADKTILDYLNLAETQKEIIVSFIEKEKELKIIESFKKSSYFLNKGGAVAFTVPLGAVSRSTLEYISL